MAVTAAFGTTAPVGSAATPTIVPVVTWAEICPDAIASTKSADCKMRRSATIDLLSSGCSSCEPVQSNQANGLICYQRVGAATTTHPAILGGKTQEQRAPGSFGMVASVKLSR